MQEVDVKRSYIFRNLIFAGVFLAAVNFGVPDVEIPEANANAAAAQTLPASAIIKSGARDARTFENDKALEAACRKSGQDKAVCLCATYVMKYEMSLSSYRAATMLYGQEGDRSDLYKALARDGYHEIEIDLAEDMERKLTRASDFAMRCANAKAYYKALQK